MHGRERRRRSDLPLHDASTGTARSAWTARRRTRWRGLIALKDRFDVAFGNDTDADRHGIVTRERGPAEPQPLPGGRHLRTCSRTARAGAPTRRVGKTLVSSSLIDRVAARARAAAASRCRSASSGSCDGLLDGSLGFGGEESAGASFLRRDGTVWTTDKDGIILGPARSGDDGNNWPRPREIYRDFDSRMRPPL